MKISNAERRILNEEVAIRGPSEFVLLLDTNYLLLFLMSNAERRILNQEEKHPTIIRILYFTELARSISIVFQFYLNSKLLGTLYLVHRTNNFLITYEK